MLLPHITTKDANGAGAHKSWCPFPVSSTVKGQRDTNSRAHFGVAKWAFYSEQPFRGPQPLYRESGRFCKYPWGSNLEKVELGTEPSSVHPLPSGTYCRSPSLLGTLAIFCVGKLLYHQEGINSPVKFWVNPQYFSQKKNCNFYFLVFNKKPYNGDVKDRVQYVFTEHCLWLPGPPVAHWPQHWQKLMGFVIYSMCVCVCVCQRNPHPCPLVQRLISSTPEVLQTAQPFQSPSTQPPVTCSKPISQTVSAPQHSGFMYDTVWMKNGQVGGKRHQSQCYPAFPGRCSCTPIRTTTLQKQKASFDSSPCHWKLRRRGQKQVKMNVCWSQLLGFCPTHPY